jgi:serine/threonine protein kinase
MAEVFKARVLGAAGFEKLVAIKKLHPHLSEDAEMVAMLKDEARLVSNMVHPNICQVFDFDRLDDTYCISMEFIHGKDISGISRAERTRNSKIPVDISLYIIRQTLTGLDYAHRMTDPVSGNILNLIHRDISPQNILVSYNGGVKIIDFGIAKVAESLHHTQSGVIKGKFRYMAPEQASGKACDHRVDIF